MAKALNIFRFVDLHYANALYVYRRMDGYGESEKFRASGASAFYALGIWLFAYSTLQRLTGSLTVLWQQLPVFYKVGYTEFILSATLSIALIYFWLWRRSPELERRYDTLTTRNSKWMLALGMLNQLFFTAACVYGLVNYWASLAIVAMIVFAQDLQYRALMNRLNRPTGEPLAK